MNTLTWISRNVMNFKVIIVLSFFLLILLVVQLLVATVVRGSMITWEDTCTFKGWDEDEEYLGFVIDCGANGTDITRNTKFIRSYLMNPGPLHCRQDLDEDIDCDVRPKQK